MATDAGFRADKRGLFPAWIKPAVGDFMSYLTLIAEMGFKDTEPPPLLVYKVKIAAFTIVLMLYSRYMS
jgi:hypothetical protein